MPPVRVAFIAAIAGILYYRSKARVARQKFTGKNEREGEEAGRANKQGSTLPHAQTHFAYQPKTEPSASGTEYAANKKKKSEWTRFWRRARTPISIYTLVLTILTCVQAWYAREQFFTMNRQLDVMGS